jgi:hypothetical protein
MTGLKSASRVPVYQVSLKDADGFPTVVVAGSSRDHVWLYVHDTAPTVLRLHQSVVRFLVDVLREVTVWFDRPERERDSLVWTLPRGAAYPHCVLVASHRRAWLHVFAASPSVVRFNPRMAQFLLEALAELPIAATGEAYRWIGRASGLDQTQIGHLDEVAR